jgi:DNA mismatch repair protein MutL
MAKIAVLSDETIDQIAAGEVIENPASVVKELVENSLDAGSHHITVEVIGGGFQLIRISDDGCGMGPEDAALCLARHATSKIIKPDDLLSLETMGFRGEALSSIAAISRLTLLTALQDGVGTQVQMEGGKLVSIEKMARTAGTTVEVRSLFYNVPARRQFQKSAAASFAEIHRQVQLLSLGHPECGFELIHQDKTVFRASVCQDGCFDQALKDRLKAAWGEAWLESSYPVHFQQAGNWEKAGSQVVGWLGSPLEAKPNRTGQAVFINRRLFYSPLISWAVKEGFGNRLSEQKYPVFAIHLFVSPDQIDVNVHPQKSRVRFRDEKQMKEMVLEAVRTGLQQAPIASGATGEMEASFSFPLSEPALRFQEEKRFAEMNLPFSSQDLSLGSMGVIGLFSHYLLVDGFSLEGYRSGIVLIDLIAASAKLAWEVDHVDQTAQELLLIPIKVDLTPVEADQVEAYFLEIQRLGISLRRMGDDCFVVDALPSYLEPGKIKDLILSFAQEGNSMKRQGMAAVRQFQKREFVLEEAVAIFERLLKAPSCDRCFDGMVTMVHLKDEQITQLFSK